MDDVILNDKIKARYGDTKRGTHLYQIENSLLYKRWNNLLPSARVIYEEYGKLCSRDTRCSCINMAITELFRVHTHVNFDRYINTIVHKINNPKQLIKNEIYREYRPTFKYLLPMFEKKYKKYGISISYDSGVLTRWITLAPDIRDSIIVKETSTFVGHYFQPVHQEMEIIKQLNKFDSLVYGLFIHHHTLYVDEILILRELPNILPQPIAEAITDCIQGIMTRRLMPKRYVFGVHIWNSLMAKFYEVVVTYFDMYGKYIDDNCLNPKDIQGIDTLSWEECAKKLHDNPPPCQCVPNFIPR